MQLYSLGHMCALRAGAGRGVQRVQGWAARRRWVVRVGHTTLPTAIIIIMAYLPFFQPLLLLAQWLLYLTEAFCHWVLEASISNSTISLLLILRVSNKKDRWISSFIVAVIHCSKPFMAGKSFIFQRNVPFIWFHTFKERVCMLVVSMNNFCQMWSTVAKQLNLLDSCLASWTIEAWWNKTFWQFENIFI